MAKAKTARITEPKIIVDKAAGKITIELPLNPEPVESKSGKTLVIASTHGNYRSEAEYNGCQVIVGVNAFFKP